MTDAERANLLDDTRLWEFEVTFPTSFSTPVDVEVRHMPLSAKIVNVVMKPGWVATVVLVTECEPDADDHDAVRVFRFVKHPCGIGPPVTRKYLGTVDSDGVLVHVYEVTH
jgi:hypothetical protein